mmetsp:Transcript_49494/g.111325  ORF Transcript_49494/g.111325 Transcript_49494/m.111325 type:complete len:131 (-) Transcript_49494:244-636(-)
MTVAARAPRAASRRHAVVAALVVLASVLGLAQQLVFPTHGSSPAFVAAPAPGRRAALFLFGGGGVAAGGALVPPAFAMSSQEEACLSKCVYGCSGGARGKGEEFKARGECVAQCKDECLPKEEEEVMVLS